MSLNGRSLIASHFGAFVDVEQHRRLAELARAHERSMSAEVRLALQAHLERGRGGGIVNPWTVVLGFQAQRDLWTFPWSAEVERGGIVTGRWESARIASTDTGRDLFIRRIFASDYGGTHTAVDIDYESVKHLQTIPTRRSTGRPGRTGADDYGLWVGCIHSHPGIERIRELSDTDVRSAAGNAREAPAAFGLAGRPFLSMLATAGEGWSEGMPEEDWVDPQFDFFLVSADRSIVRPTVLLQTETEWEVEEGQRRALAAGGER